MRKYILFLTLTFTISVSAQFSVSSITPADGSTNLAQSNIISVEFSQALDTTRAFEFFEDYFTNAFDQDSIWYSADSKIVNIKVNLEAEKNYYFLVYSATAQTTENLTNPKVVYFTTADSLTGRTVSGTVSAQGESGLDFSRTLVALSSTPIGDGEPMIEIGTFANTAGEFIIPYVVDGDYYPLAANDANDDGRLDPSGGDAFSFLDMINISNDYSGLNFELNISEPLSLINAAEISDSISRELFVGNSYLKMIRTWNTDTLGNAGEWEFLYLTDSLNQVSILRIDQFGYRLEDTADEWGYQGLVNMDELPSIENSVDLSVFMEYAESAGGRDFRTQDKTGDLEFHLEIILADHRYSHLSYLNPDTSKHIMWAASYRWYDQVSEDDWEQESELVFFGDFETGELIITDIEDHNIDLPNLYTLDQNYPNPFNPSTTIEYTISRSEVGEQRSEFVNLSIYDLLGRRIKILVNEKQKPGSYEVELDGSELTSGIYFYRLRAGNFVETKKMVLIQ